MKIHTGLFKTKLAAGLLAVSVGISAYAEPPRDELVHAYHLLEKANKDYAGHRAAAMDEVKAAGRELGLHLEGDIPDAERQWKSDRQLTEARRLLRDAREKLEARDRDRVAGHVDRAMKELDVALHGH